MVQTVASQGGIMLQNPRALPTGGGVVPIHLHVGLSRLPPATSGQRRDRPHRKCLLLCNNSQPPARCFCGQALGSVGDSDPAPLETTSHLKTWPGPESVPRMASPPLPSHEAPRAAQHGSCGLRRQPPRRKLWRPLWLNLAGRTFAQLHSVGHADRTSWGGGLSA